LQVLERLFELTPFSLSDFNNFRLVNKTWLKESMPMYRQNVWIKMNNYETEKEISTADSFNLKRFLTLSELPDDPHQLLGAKNSFKKYRLDGWTFDFWEPAYAENQNQVKFFKNVGSLMTHLIISNCSFYNRDKFREIIFEHAPNIQFLSLNGNHYFYSPVATTERNAEANWAKLFKHPLPPSKIQGNLEELQINLTSNSDLSADFSVEWVEIFRAFPNIRVR